MKRRDFFKLCGGGVGATILPIPATPVEWKGTLLSCRDDAADAVRYACNWESMRESHPFTMREFEKFFRDWKTPQVFYTPTQGKSFYRPRLFIIDESTRLRRRGANRMKAWFDDIKITGGRYGKVQEETSCG